MRTALCLAIGVLVLLTSACSDQPDSGEGHANAYSNMSYADAPILPSTDGWPSLPSDGRLAMLQRAGLPVPEVVLIETDPWVSVPGTESPRFVLYADGLVIYRDGSGYRSVRLSRQELRAFRDAIAPARDNGLAGRYDVALGTDMPDNLLLLYGEQPLAAAVYGPLDDVHILQRIPSRLADVYRRIATFRHDLSRPWQPEMIEVMIWPYENAPGRSIQWKKEWPGLSHPQTLQRSTIHSLFLPVEERPALEAFLATRPERGAIIIDGQKWVADLRIPFPSEDLWMGR